MSKALFEVKSAVRTKILLNRLGEEDPASTPFLEEGEKSVGERLQYAKASLRPAASLRRASAQSQSADAPAVNWFYQDMFAIGSLITASWLNLLAVSLMESFVGWERFRKPHPKGTHCPCDAFAAIHSCGSCLWFSGMGSHADVLLQHGVPHPSCPYPG